MRRGNYLKGYLPWQSGFDHHYACWAANHRGWAKMKKSNKRLAKKREKRHWKREVKNGEGKAEDLSGPEGL